MTIAPVKGARGAKREAMAEFNRLINLTPKRHCRDKVVEYTELLHTAEEAREMCGVDTEWECPILAQCRAEGRRTKPDGLVLGGQFWRKGKPVAG